MNLPSSRILWALALAGLSVSFVPAYSAESKTTPPSAADSGQKAQARERLQAALAELNLTPEQKEKLLPLLQAESEKLAALRANQDLRPRQKLQRMKALRDELTPKVKAILTPEQFALWEQKRAEAREELRGKLRDRQG